MNARITYAHARRRHAGWYTQTVLTVAATAISCIACGVVVGTILTLSVVGPVLHGLGVAL